jgi:protein-arginine kinase activator protein McsA
MKNKLQEAKCPKCKYSWSTKSKMRNVTCPNCLCKFIPILQDSEEEKK